MIDDVLQDVKQDMQATIDSLKKDCGVIRTGRATTAILDSITVDYHGARTQLKQLASLSVPESRLIVVQPWDKTIVEEVEKAILRSDLGLNPVSDGNIIRIPIPQLTEERRRELAKMVNKTAEDHRVSIRNARRDGNEFLKQLEKEKEISEDDKRRGQEQIQKLTDQFIKNLDEVVTQKEKEVMED